MWHGLWERYSCKENLKNHLQFILKFVCSLVTNIGTFQVIMDEHKKNLHMSLEQTREALIRAWDEIEKLKQKIQELEDKSSKNSRNSSKPPSSDGLEKPSPKSRREKTNKKVGGQVGHKGVTLEPIESPDRIEILKVELCTNCGANLSGIEPTRYDYRQVIDIPQYLPEVVEYQAEIKLCELCSRETAAEYPNHVTQRVQYGPNIKSYTVYLNQYQFIPYDRLQTLFNDCYGLCVSQGTLVNFTKKCSELIEPTIEEIKSEITKSDVAHFDESGMRVHGKINWLHVISTLEATYYEIHQKRGKVAMDDIDILPNYTGTAVHDHWKSYFRYRNSEHALCNAHYLRELEFAAERYNQTWAQEMKKLLLDINKKVNEHKVSGKKALAEDVLEAYKKEYEGILEKGNPEIPPPPLRKGKRGRKKQHKVKNLWDRMNNYQREVLRFMHDFRVPFTNNLAEQDIRMCKIKAKVSGSFRSESGKEAFCRIRSYISTAKKRSKNVLDVIKDAFSGDPMTLSSQKQKV